MRTKQSQQQQLTHQRVSNFCNHFGLLLMLVGQLVFFSGFEGNQFLLFDTWSSWSWTKKICPTLSSVSEPINQTLTGTTIWKYFHFVLIISATTFSHRIALPLNSRFWLIEKYLYMFSTVCNKNFIRFAKYKLNLSPSRIVGPTKRIVLEPIKIGSIVAKAKKKNENPPSLGEPRNMQKCTRWRQSNNIIIFPSRSKCKCYSLTALLLWERGVRCAPLSRGELTRAHTHTLHKSDAIECSQRQKLTAESQTVRDIEIKKKKLDHAAGFLKQISVKVYLLLNYICF